MGQETLAFGCVGGIDIIYNLQDANWETDQIGDSILSAGRLGSSISLSSYGLCFYNAGSHNRGILLDVQNFHLLCYHVKDESQNRIESNRNGVVSKIVGILKFISVNHSFVTSFCFYMEYVLCLSIKIQVLQKTVSEANLLFFLALSN